MDFIIKKKIANTQKGHSRPLLFLTIIKNI